MVPPADLTNCTDPEITPYAKHVYSCDDCNEMTRSCQSCAAIPRKDEQMALKIIPFNGILTGQVLTMTSKCVVAAEEVTVDYSRTVRLTKVHIERVAETLSGRHV